MKKIRLFLSLITISIIFLVMISIIWYTIRHRYSISETYKKWLTNEQLFTGWVLEIIKPKEFIKTIYLPLKTQSFDICITGSNIINFFFVFDVLWYKEYKPSSWIQWWDNGTAWCFWITPSQTLVFDSEIWLKHQFLFRNTFLDKWWSFVWVAIQLAPLSWENIIISESLSEMSKIISWSNTLNSHTNILKENIFTKDAWNISIPVNNRNILLRGDQYGLLTNSLIIISKTGTLAISLMTYNPLLLNSMEPKYKWPFTNNIIENWEKIQYSNDSLSGYIDINDKYLFILISNISTWIASFQYSIDKK